MDDSRKRSLDPKTSSNIIEPDSKKTAVDKAKEIAQRIAQKSNIGSSQGFSTALASHSSDTKVFERKVYFPVDKFPGTNFVGLILGPKAQTLKELQQTLRVNLTIKGEGLSQKSGQQNIENINEPQHVFISAQSQELADQAEEYISQICNDPNKQEELKMRQKMLLGQTQGQPSLAPQFQLQNVHFQQMQQPQPQQQPVFENYSSYPQTYSNELFQQGQNISMSQNIPPPYLSQVQPQIQSYSAPISQGSNMTSKIVQVPQELAGAVIGRGGDQIKQFQLHSQAHIQIDNSLEAQRQPIGTFRNVTLSGTLEQVTRAEQLINNFVANKTQGLTQTQGHALQTTGSNLSSIVSSNVSLTPGTVPNTNQTGALNYPCQMRIEVPNNKVGLIIGKQGKTVHRIQNSYRCKIDIPLGPDHDNPEVRTLTIGAYTENDLELTKNDIINVIAYQNMEAQTQSGLNMSTAFTQQTQNVAQTVNQQVAYSVEVPKESVEYVAEYVNSNIIQAKTGCTLQLNKNERSIVVTGTQDKADLAISEISNIVQHWQQNQSQVSSGQQKIDNAQQNGQGQAKQQKYTREEWQQWKAYYKTLNIDMDDEPPLELRADNYV